MLRGLPPERCAALTCITVAPDGGRRRAALTEGWQHDLPPWCYDLGFVLDVAIGQPKQALRLVIITAWRYDVSTIRRINVGQCQPKMASQTQPLPHPRRMRRSNWPIRNGLRCPDDVERRAHGIPMALADGLVGREGKDGESWRR